VKTLKRTDNVSPRIAAVGKPAATTRRLVSFTSGRQVTIEDGSQDRLMVSDPNGRFEVSIRFTDAGPVLEVDAVALSMRAETSVAIDCDSLVLSTRETLVLQSEGNLVERVAGNKRSEVSGESSLSARDVRIASEDGAIELESAGDLRLDAQRVLVNC
jgi:hypothetical protein